MAEGDVGGVIDNLEFEAADCQVPVLIHVSGDVFAIVYTGTDTDGWLRTVTIASDGEIENTVEDTYEFETVQCNNPSMVHVDGDVFVIAYTGIDGDGWLKTVEIAIDGAISEPFISSYEFDAGFCRRPDIIQISDNVFAIVAGDVANDGWIKTVAILSNGTITPGILDSLEFATADGKECKIIKRSDNVYIVVFKDGADNLRVTTIEVLSNGDIGNSVIDAYTFATGTFYEPRIIQISGNVFAVAYYDVGVDGWISTITIAEDGTITAAVLDTYEFDTESGKWVDIIHVSGNVYALGYQDSAGHGRIKTVEIATNGAISEPFISSGVFNAVAAENANLLHVNGNVYAVAHRGPDNDGWLTTIEIGTAGAARAHNEMMMGMGP